MPLSNIALAALPPRDEDRPARFGLELSPGQEPRELTVAVTEQLAELDPRVTPISPVDHGVLVLELGTVTLQGVEPAAAFAAGYALADDFGLRTAEPDLPTPFFFEEEPRPAGMPDEEAIRFPPGCWVDDEKQLSTGWALDRINAPQAWQFSLDQGRPAYGRGVVIAQPDTGVVPHVELVGVPRQGGYDVVSHDNDPTDPLTGRYAGHGTGTASVMVASSSVGRITGSAPEATHMPIRAVTTVVRTSQVSVAAAIERAVDDGAHVISMSLGGVPAAVLRRALHRAVAADVIVLAAAGNCVRTVVWPARYDTCIAVGGTAADDSMWRGSCRGSAVDIAAPAQNVYRAEVSSQQVMGQSVGIDQGQGTSFAVALTAGAAALWLAHHGRAGLVAAARARGETLQQLFRRLLCATARRPAGWDPFELGAGTVDARALLAADFDLGRDRESLEPLGAAGDDAVPVAALVAETAGYDAVPGPDFDWARYGPELSTGLLAGQLAQLGTEAEGEAVGDAGTAMALSGPLAVAIDNPRLRDHFRLDDELPAEVMEVPQP